jgi:hypothetical protein
MIIDESKLKDLNEKFKERNGVLKSDGIVNISEYVKANKNILWVLKEANWDSKSDVDMINFFQDITAYSKWKRTYKLIIQVSWSILNGYVTYDKVPNLSDIMDVMGKIALININKIGGQAESDGKIISESYFKNKDLLLKQVEVINPNVIINCSGVYNFYKDIIIESYEKIQSSNFVSGKTKHGFIINAYHPNQRRISHVKFYDSIMNHCNKYFAD